MVVYERRSAIIERRHNICSTRPSIHSHLLRFSAINSLLQAFLWHRRPCRCGQGRTPRFIGASRLCHLFRTIRCPLCIFGLPVARRCVYLIDITQSIKSTIEVRRRSAPMRPSSSRTSTGPKIGDLPCPTMKADFLGKHFPSLSRRAFTPRSRRRSGGRAAPCQDSAQFLPFFGPQRPLFVKMFMKTQEVRGGEEFFGKNLSS